LQELVDAAFITLDNPAIRISKDKSEVKRLSEQLSSIEDTQMEWVTRAIEQSGATPGDIDTEDRTNVTQLVEQVLLKIASRLPSFSCSAGRLGMSRKRSTISSKSIAARRSWRRRGSSARKPSTGDKTTKVDILGLVDDTHPAITEFFGDAVVRDGLADHGVRFEGRL
jgi:hypothetical protein